MSSGSAQTVEESNRLEEEVVRLYEDSFAGLFRYAMTIVRDRELSEDKIQECFLRYFIARKEGQLIGNGKAWLYRVLRNQLLDAVKRGAYRKNVSIEAAAERADIRQDPEAEFRRTEFSKRLVASLTPRELECLQLRAEGFRYEEIAAVLSIRSGTVGAMLARAVKKAREIVNAERNKECWNA